MNKKTIETKNCKQCNLLFNITDKDMKFYDKISPNFNGQKFQIPSPTFCPDCRQQRRLAWRNERKLYKRKCDATGKDIVSIYSEDKEYIIYETNYWWSDKWDELEYGILYNIDENFFTQFDNLLKKVPRLSILNSKGENSDFCNNSIGEKNCYLSFVAGYNEDSSYLHFLGYTKKSFDLLWGWANDNCYETIKTSKSVKCFYCINCNECYESSYLEDCNGVKNSCFCIGLTNQKYNFLNKKYSKTEYEQILFKLENNEEFFNKTKEEYKNLRLKFPHVDLKIIKSENVTGDHISFSKDCYNCFDCDNSENLTNCYDCFELINSMDTYVTGSTYEATKSELIYESENLVNVFKCLFSSTIWDGNNMIYCDSCFNSKNCFGSVGLKYKEYCILNKQYTKEEYNIRVPKIIEHMQSTGEWGEFFPSDISPFGYNETIANEYFPLEKNEAKEKGFNWSDYIQAFPKVEKVIPARKLPEDIKKIPDDILNWAVKCEKTQKLYRIIKEELEFYRKHNLPIPKIHPDQRHLERLKLRNPRKIFDRKCDKCCIDMKTTFGPDREERVYCEECYNNEIY